VRVAKVEQIVPLREALKAFNLKFWFDPGSGLIDVQKLLDVASWT
jgi:hypothetical protein